MEKAPSAGKTVAIGGFSASSAIVLTLYVAKHCGLDDMTPEVAAAIVSLAIGFAGAIMHNTQRHEEKKTDPTPQNGVTQ